MTTQRAPAGGAFGANGEWYEGGKFINSIPENRKREGSTPRKARKIEIEPYVWVVPTESDSGISLYRNIAGIFGRVENGVMVLRTDSQLQQTLNYCGRTIEEVRDMIDRYNAGQRWM